MLCFVSCPATRLGRSPCLSSVLMRAAPKQEQFQRSRVVCSLHGQQNPPGDRRRNPLSPPLPRFFPTTRRSCLRWEHEKLHDVLQKLMLQLLKGRPVWMVCHVERGCGWRLRSCVGGIDLPFVRDGELGVSQRRRGCECFRVFPLTPGRRKTVATYNACALVPGLTARLPLCWCS